MQLRRNFMPRCFADWLSFIFISVVIPLYYWFEMFIVLQEFYPYTSFWYWWHFCFGTFVMTNTVSNLLATMFIDTSVFSVHISALKNCGIKFCASCQLPVPPRCWHCDLCNRCVLKRDHHCTFAGYCIGHSNHRFFMMFLTYFCIACLYALYLDLFYILPKVDLSITIVLQIITPVLLLLIDAVNAYKYMLTMVLVLNIAGVVITGILLYFHWRLVFEGAVSFEHNRSITQYNYGLKTNVICVFGVRWYLTWVSPFIESALVFDGVEWDLNNVLKKTKII